MSDTGDVYIAALSAGEVFADPTYQRVLDVVRARKMAASWDRRLAGILEVSDRGEQASPRYAVLDGQHRWAAAQYLRPTPPLVANVHTGLTLADEAALFDKLNRQRKQISTWDHWKARSAAADPTVVAIEQVIVNYGLTIDPAPRDGCVGCVGTLEKVAKIDTGLLDETMGFITGVWSKRRDALDAAIIHGLALILHKLRNELDHQRLTDAMVDVLPRQLRTQATALRDNVQPGTLPVVTAIVIMGHYNKRPGRKIDVNHKTFGGTGISNQKRPASAKGPRLTNRLAPPDTLVSAKAANGLTVIGSTALAPRPTNAPPPVPETEQYGEAVMQMADRSDIEIADTLGIPARTVRRIRADLGLEP